MGWTEFIKYLASGYLFYYGLLVILDLLKPQKDLLLTGEEDLLEFPEESPATIISEEEAYGNSALGMQPSTDEAWPLYRMNTNVSTGGVSSMTDLFRLAQDETIEVKKQLVY